MAIIQVYLWFTVAVFAWGPWDWNNPHPWKIYTFLTLAHVALLLGYLQGLRQTVVPYSGALSSKALVNVGIWVSVLVFIPTNLFRTGTMLPQVAQGLLNPGAAYDTSYLLRTSADQAPLAEYLRFLLGPLLALAVPLGIYYWKELSRVQQAGVVFVVLSTVAMFISMGTNKAIADTVIIVPWLIAAGAAGKRFNLSKRLLFVWVCILGIGVSSFFLFFRAGSISRGEGAGFAVSGVFSHIDVKADMDHPLVANASLETRVGILGLSFYLTGGYQALAMSLEEPWVPCYGIGNSFFLQRQVERILDRDDLASRTYPARIEARGWDSVGLWSSIYPWLASDVSFPGTLLVVFWIGGLFARLWRDVIDGGNPIAVSLFSQVVIMLFYFPANNQVLQFGEGLSAFVVTLAVWHWTRSQAAKPLLEAGVVHD
ncbi:MAG: hypothetical protein IPP58_16025 [Holophagaceae bacterium]|uniref:Oligosaccharide repeat unit polymerase n=1 Tax=Candidatus Geothrix skivensis TaxID=2954439 RepID=A0A9D7SJQ5_9BACT|nr:hypothetical protein [Candidatus Geothrix skivensis]